MGLRKMSQSYFCDIVAGLFVSPCRYVPGAGITRTHARPLWRDSVRMGETFSGPHLFNGLSNGGRRERLGEVKNIIRHIRPSTNKKKERKKYDLKSFRDNLAFFLFYLNSIVTAERCSHPCEKDTALDGQRRTTMDKREESTGAVVVGQRSVPHNLTEARTVGSCRPSSSQSVRKNI
ncbi:hypothetical protein PoB_007025300 [Plakobranchus ocellatus]|uniref:Uncharacterized protein n=1 Tax=Plakobranchus ocellatus TaxID=259542 RepID=A0AAV4DI63_9GAST|nr:hypothetical protein PoB_007025300 [Plakobranchus ocellatus]